MSNRVDESTVLTEDLRFPEKLWLMVTQKCPRSIFWTPKGTSFKIHCPTFEEECLSVESIFFKTTSLQSFFRQLNIYYFKKMPSIKLRRENHRVEVQHEFVHDFFQSGKPELLVQVQRKKAPSRKNASAKSAASKRKGRKRKAHHSDSSEEEDDDNTDGTYHFTGRSSGESLKAIHRKQQITAKKAPKRSRFTAIRDRSELLDVGGSNSVAKTEIPTSSKAEFPTAAGPSDGNITEFASFSLEDIETGKRRQSVRLLAKKLGKNESPLATPLPPQPRKRDCASGSKVKKLPKAEMLETSSNSSFSQPGVAVRNTTTNATGFAQKANFIFVEANSPKAGDNSRPFQYELPPFENFYTDRNSVMRFTATQTNSKPSVKKASSKKGRTRAARPLRPNQQRRWYPSMFESLAPTPSRSGAESLGAVMSPLRDIKLEAGASSAKFQMQNHQTSTSQPYNHSRTIDTLYAASSAGNMNVWPQHTTTPTSQSAKLQYSFPDMAVYDPSLFHCCSTIKKECKVNSNPPSALNSSPFSQYNTGTITSVFPGKMVTKNVQSPNGSEANDNSPPPWDSNRHRISNTDVKNFNPFTGIKSKVSEASSRRFVGTAISSRIKKEPLSDYEQARLSTAEHSYNKPIEEKVRTVPSNRTATLSGTTLVKTEGSHAPTKISQSLAEYEVKNGIIFDGCFGLNGLRATTMKQCAGSIFPSAVVGQEHHTISPSRTSENLRHVEVITIDDDEPQKCHKFIPDYGPEELQNPHLGYQHMNTRDAFLFKEAIDRVWFNPDFNDMAAPVKNEQDSCPWDLTVGVFCTPSKSHAQRNSFSSNITVPPKSQHCATSTQIKKEFSDTSNTAKRFLFNNASNSLLSLPPRMSVSIKQEFIDDHLSKANSDWKNAPDNQQPTTSAHVYSPLCRNNLPELNVSSTNNPKIRHQVMSNQMNRACSDAYIPIENSGFNSHANRLQDPNIQSSHTLTKDYDKTTRSSRSHAYKTRRRILQNLQMKKEVIDISDESQQFENRAQIRKPSLFPGNEVKEHMDVCSTNKHSGINGTYEQPTIGNTRCDSNEALAPTTEIKQEWMDDFNAYGPGSNATGCPSIPVHQPVHGLPMNHELIDISEDRCFNAADGQQGPPQDQSQSEEIMNQVLDLISDDLGNIVMEAWRSGNQARPYP